MTDANDTREDRDAVARLLLQQRAIAEFGLFALREPTLQPALDEAARLASEGLGCPLAKVLERLPGEGRLLVRAGVGWRPGVVGEATVGADLASPAGFALQTGQPVLSNHLSGETRFRTPALMAEHGIRRAINVIVRGDAEPFGVLEADSPDPGEFVADDILFLQALANTLAIAIEREIGRRKAEERQALLLREIHHRVKNSLQLVQSTLLLGVRELEGDARRGLEEAAARVKTIAAVHDRLYKGTSLLEVDVPAYLDGLVADLRASLADAGGGRSVELAAADPDTWPADGAPTLGLVAAELVTNALKYGRGTVRLFYRWLPDAGEITVEDEGEGFPADFDPRRSCGLGMRLVTAFARGPSGGIAVDRDASGGRIVVCLPRQG
ncbi:sensor histidine kinase [Roseicella sp. DB1501]|uniref:sensor histidine kinase n=1 Tax=Roseicella sp. DB1501 TaxID=2730925 RepID=UPI001491CD99|nr:histidine kinase dimerization/phosphoacceptor domain -containing protein [Roseicella sp. DB1501]NOG74176.1 GAF domain-containing protein [Roseicella sp. DB1501]